MNHTSLVVSLALAMAVPAQAPIETALSATSSVISARAVRCAAPREALPKTATLQATAKMAYVAWQEGTTSASAVNVARTSDGGVSWTLAQVYATVASETITDLKITACAYSVFVGILSNRKNPGVARNDAYVLGSSDEGATWSAPLLVNTGTTTAPRGDAQLLELASGLYLGNARCYAAYEHSPVATNEDPYFTAVELQSGAIVPVVAELRLNKGATAGATDVDDVAVDCEGGNVCLAWRDYRGNATTADNDMWAVVSLQGGADLGSAAVTEKKVSLNAGLGEVEPPSVAVAGTNCYVYWLDHRNDLTTTALDDAFLAYSNDLGANWNEVNLSGSLVHPVDIDGGSIAASGNTVVIAFEDDTRARTLATPPADPNKCDSVAVLVSTNGGATRTSTYVSTPPTTANWVRCEQPQVAMRGGFIHLVWEESWYNTATVAADEDMFMAKSYDGGATFTPAINVTKRGSPARGQTSGGGDVDQPLVTVTGNGEGVASWLNKPLLSTPTIIYANAAVRGGLEVWSKFMGAPGLEVRDVPPSQAGGFTLVLLTFDPNPVPLYLPTIFGNFGFEPLLVPDFATSVGLQVAGVLSTLIPAAGGTVPLPAAPDLGGTVYVVATTFNFTGPAWLSFSPRGKY